MAALTKNRVIPTSIQRSTDGYEFVANYPIEAAKVIYEGSLLSIDTTGYVHVIDTADGQFLGVALEAATGGTSSGDVSVKVGVGGVIEHAVASAATATPGAATVMDVFASDDNTMTVVATGGLRCGSVVRFVGTAEGGASTTSWVKLKVPQGPIS